MGLGPTAVCDALSCHVSLMWLINLPSSVSSVGRPSAWKCNLLLPTHTHKHPDAETDVMNGQVVICSRITGPRFSPFSSLYDISLHPLRVFKVINSSAVRAASDILADLWCPVFVTRLAFFAVNRDLIYHSSGPLHCFVSFSYRSARISVCHSQ